VSEEHVEIILDFTGDMWQPSGASQMAYSGYMLLEILKKHGLRTDWISVGLPIEIKRLSIQRNQESLGGGHHSEMN